MWPRLCALSLFLVLTELALSSHLALALAQERLSLSNIESLLSAGVAPRRLAELVKERGIDFDVTDDVKSRLIKLGATPAVIQSVDGADVRNRLQKSVGPKRDDSKQAQQPTTPTPAAKADTPVTKESVKNTEAAKGSEKNEATKIPPQQSSSYEKQDISQEKVVTLPTQLQEKADYVLALQNIVIRDGDVSGELVNKSQQGVYGVELQVLYSWRWNNDFHPGRDDPGRAEYFKIDKEISPGQRVPFVHKPSPPLPERKDGVFDISVKVISFTKIFRETKGR